VIACVTRGHSVGFGHGCIQHPRLKNSAPPSGYSLRCRFDWTSLNHVPILNQSLWRGGWTMLIDQSPYEPITVERGLDYAN
jgi:hypothetical protein